MCQRGAGEEAQEERRKTVPAARERERGGGKAEDEAGAKWRKGRNQGGRNRGEETKGAPGAKIEPVKRRNEKCLLRGPFCFFFVFV